MFISIKRYLENRPEQVIGALRRMVRLLLQGIELHTVKGDAADYDKFRADIRNVQASLSENPTSSEMLVLAGATVKALEEYNGRTNRFIHLQASELQTMVAMLTKTIAMLSTDGEGTACRLQDIERHLHKASMIEEYQTAKIRLSECLETLRGEILRQREQSARKVAELSKAVEQSRERLASARAVAAARDPVTGLIMRAEAETALAAAINENRNAYAIVFLVERIDLINNRFGHAVGDQILLFFCQHLTQALGTGDRLFRWSGPALLALLERNESLAGVRDEMGRIAARRLSKTAQVGMRAVLLAVAADWAAFSLQETRPVQVLIQHIDSFVGGSAPARATA